MTSSDISKWMRSPALQLAILAMLAVAGNFARTMFTPLQEAIRVALDLGDNQIALVQGLAMALPVVILSIAIGVMLDRFSRARLIFLFLLFALVGNLITAAASGFATVFLARCLIGLSVTALSTASLALVADFFPSERRGRATMLLTIGGMAGNSAAFAAGGHFLVATGDWRKALLLCVAMLVPILLVTLALVEPAQNRREGKREPFTAYFPLLWARRAPLSLVLLGLLSIEIAFGAVYVWAAPLYIRLYALAPDQVGSMIAAGFLAAGIAGPCFGGYLADRWQATGGPRRSMLGLCALALIALPTSAFGLVGYAAVSACLLLLYISIITAMIVIGTTLFTIVAPPEARALSVTILFGVSVLFGIGVAPLTVSLISTVIGGPAMIGVGLVVTCAIACLTAVAGFACAAAHPSHAR